MSIEAGPKAPSHLGPYEVQEQIGRGGMSVVYRGRHVRLDRAVAIKVLLEYVADSVGLERFRREAQTVARLRHPSILAVFDFGEENGVPYMVTEFMPNGSLAARKRDRALSLEDTIALLTPVADALDYAHAEGVIHRDVKPSNIFLDAAWRPVLADFGISRLSSDTPLTSTGAVTGTPAYMSPEQLKGGEVEAPADVYALTVVAFELLTGGTPFAADDPWKVMYGQVNVVAPLASSLVAGLAPIDEVLARGLAKDPAERWPTCAAMLEALAAAPKRRPRRWRLRLRRGQPGGGSSPPLLRVAAVAAVLVSAGLLAASQLLVQHAGIGAPGAATPTPAAPAAKRLMVNSAQPLHPGATMSFRGDGLDPSRRAVAGFVRSGSHIYPVDQSLDVAADGSFRLTAQVPADLPPGAATLIACNVADDGSFQLSQDCAQTRVEVAG